MTLTGLARRTGRFPQLVDPRSSVNGLLLTGSPGFREVSLEVVTQPVSAQAVCAADAHPSRRVATTAEALDQLFRGSPQTRHSRIVNRSLVSFETNRYSVRFRLIGQEVEVRRQHGRSRCATGARWWRPTPRSPASISSRSSRSTGPAPSRGRSGVCARRRRCRG
jgi:hypothetical protein